MSILSRCAQLALAGTVALGLGSLPAQAANTVTIDFDNVPGATHGLVLNNWNGVGGTGLNISFSAQLQGGAPSYAVLFDSTYPGKTQDPDLIQPYYFEPTSGLTNSYGTPYNPGFILIAQNENPQAPNQTGNGFTGCGGGVCTYPNDEIGGTLTLRLDQPVTFHGLDLFDATRSNISLFDAGGNLLFSSLMPSVAGTVPPDNNLYGTFLTRPISGVRTIAVEFANLRGSGDSGAIDNLRVELVPEPSTWAMMILAFGLIGWRVSSERRRERVAIAA